MNWPQTELFKYVDVRDLVCAAGVAALFDLCLILILFTGFFDKYENRIAYQSKALQMPIGWILLVGVFIVIFCGVVYLRLKLALRRTGFDGGEELMKKLAPFRSKRKKSNRFGPG